MDIMKWIAVGLIVAGTTRDWKGLCLCLGIAILVGNVEGKIKKED